MLVLVGGKRPLWHPRALGPGGRGPTSGRGLWCVGVALLGPESWFRWVGLNGEGGRVLWWHLFGAKQWTVEAESIRVHAVRRHPAPGRYALWAAKALT